MFTGIIETLGVVKYIQKEGSNIHFEIESEISNSLHIDQSVSHNGVCLTVTKISASAHFVTAIEETLTKSNLGLLQENDVVNLERCLKIGDRLDGHIVQGHVDGTTSLHTVEVKDGSWVYNFDLPDQWKSHIVYKGSITINGVSLTVSKLDNDQFEVSIIPYTHAHTNFNQLKAGSMVNLEFDIVGKYILRNEALKKG